jgi:hypothetical protein
MKIPPSILRYWLAMNASAFQTTVHSVNLFLSSAAAHTVSEELPGLGMIPAISLPQLLVFALFIFARAILAYLDAHPITELLPAIPIIPPIVGKPVGPEPEPTAKQ